MSVSSFTGQNNRSTARTTLATSSAKAERSARETSWSSTAWELQDHDHVAGMGLVLGQAGVARRQFAHEVAVRFRGQARIGTHRAIGARRHLLPFVGREPSHDRSVVRSNSVQSTEPSDGLGAALTLERRVENEERSSEVYASP